MVRRSAGLLLFRRPTPAGGGPAPAFEVLLAHTGGPFWARRDLGAWSIPKGEYAGDEPALDAARREFSEELGLPVPAGELLPLGEITQKNRKVVTAWALQAELDPASIVPGTIEIEWPSGSGRMREIPEIDRVQWFEPGDAAERMFAGQQAFLDRLDAHLRAAG